MKVRLLPELLFAGTLKLLLEPLNVLLGLLGRLKMPPFVLAGVPPLNLLATGPLTPADREV